MPFTLPNDVIGGTAEQHAQASPDTGDFTILGQSISGTGVIDGCAVTANNNMVPSVAAGHVSNAGSTIAVTAGTVSVTAANATNPRFDLVAVDNTGVKSVIAGTAGTNPVFPTWPATSSILAAIYVAPTVTSIVAADIIDKRAFHRPSIGRQIVIDCGGTPGYSPAPVGTWTSLLAGPTAESWVGWTNNSDGIQNSAISFDFFSEAGTYEIDFYHLKGPVKGIYSFKIDGVALGTTIDGYSTTFNFTYDHIPPGIGPGTTVLTPGQHTITITMATKNASATQYVGQPVKIVFTRSS